MTFKTEIKNKNKLFVPNPTNSESLWANKSANRKQTPHHSMQQQNDNDKTPTNEPLTLGGAQQLVDQWVKQYGVRYFSELTNMAVLTEEVGELARQMARIYGDQSFKQGEEPNLGDEMADVLWVLLCLANQTGVNLEEELRRNIEKKTRRDKTRHINNEKLKK